MDKLVIKGGKKLKGTVVISGAKNAALPLLAATLLTNETCVLKNVPALTDAKTMAKILTELGKDILQSKGVVTVKSSDSKGYSAPYGLVSTMRGSICVLGPLVASRRRAKVSFPGGCVIGPRPIDLHLRRNEHVVLDVRRLGHGTRPAKIDHPRHLERSAVAGQQVKRQHLAGQYGTDMPPRFQVYARDADMSAVHPRQVIDENPHGGRGQDSGVRG